MAPDEQGFFSLRAVYCAMTDQSKKLALGGIQATALAAFLVGFGGTQLALPSFGLAVLGTLAAAYGIASL